MDLDSKMGPGVSPALSRVLDRFKRALKKQIRVIEELKAKQAEMEEVIQMLAEDLEAIKAELGAAPKKKE